MQDFSLRHEWRKGNSSLFESERIHLALWCFIMRSHKVGVAGALPDIQPLTDWQTEKGIMGLLVDGPSCQYYVNTSFRLIRPPICYKKLKKKINETLQCWRFMDCLKRCCRTRLDFTAAQSENCITNANISHMDEQKLAAVERVNECGSA